MIIHRQSPPRRLPTLAAIERARHRTRLYNHAKSLGLLVFDGGVLPQSAFWRGGIGWAPCCSTREAPDG